MNVSLFLGRYTRNEIIFMFVGSSWEVIGHAYVKCAISLACHYINIVLFHGVLLDSRLRGNDILLLGVILICQYTQMVHEDVHHLLKWIPVCAGMTCCGWRMSSPADNLRWCTNRETIL